MTKDQLAFDSASQRKDRDAALGRVRANPANNYLDIVYLLQDHLQSVKSGELFLAADLFAAAIKKDQTISPKDKRVMGPVMKKLEELKIIEMTKNTVHGTKKRSHCGDAKEWRRC